MKGSQNRVLCHLNGHGRNADPLASQLNNKDDFWNTQELECSKVVDDFISGIENEVKDSVAPCTITTEMFEKGTVFYTDKNVMECELPELIVCYKESTYHVVKDICIDEGLPSENKTFIENVKDDHKGLFTSLPSNGSKHSDITKESIETGFVIQDELKFSSQKDCYRDAANECGNYVEVNADLEIQDGLKSSSEVDIDQDVVYEYGPDGLKSLSESDSDQDVDNVCDPGDPMKTGEESCNATDKIMDDASRQEEFPDGLKSLSESDSDQDVDNVCDPGDPMKTGEESCNATDKIMDDASRQEEFVANSMLSVKDLRTQASLKSLFESSHYDCNDIGQQFGQISCVEAIPRNPALVLAAEESNKSPTNNVSYDSKVESGTITFNFGSCKPASSTRDQSPENVLEQPFETPNIPIHEDGFSGNLSFASQVQRGEGESSFSAAGPVSGLVSYSGPIPYSGSLSLRSDSSTTSTRSFAFPVLQSEWNSSPVRMAEADRRQFQKHRGWRQGILCCRF